MNITSNSIPDLIVGKSLGIAGAGLYDRAASVNRMVWDQLFSVIGSVMFPTFASEKRGGEDLGRAYLYRLRGLADFLWVILAWLAIYGDHALIVLYGEQWVAAGPAARALALSAILSAPFMVGRELMFAMGKTQTSFWIDTVTLAVRVGTLALAAPYGLLVMALSFMVPNIIFMAVSQVAISRLLRIRLASIFAAVLPSVIMMGLYGGVMLMLKAYLMTLGPQPSLLVLAASGAVSAVVAPFLLYMFRSPVYVAVQKLRGRSVAAEI